MAEVVEVAEGGEVAEAEAEAVGRRRGWRRRRRRRRWWRRRRGAEVVEAGPPQVGNLKLPIRVRHGVAPVVWRYSVVYQNVQSSTGSVVIIE